MSFVITPNMNLIVPGVGTEAGPTYAQDVNSSLTLIDQHDHTAGKGVQVTPAGLNISSDLSIQVNNLINVRTTRYTAQPSTLSAGSDIDCTYVSGVDLYYRDGNGNNVRITQGGNIAGAQGSISGLASPASASYNSGTSTFVWQSNANTAANMDAGSFIFRNSSVSSPGLTLSAPTLSGNYNLTLPTIPVQTNVMTLSSAGLMASITYDAVGQNMTSVGANAIAATMNSTGANAIAASMSNPSIGGSYARIDGLAAIVSAVLTATTLKIIRGTIDSSGSILAGEGFAVNSFSGGAFSISFGITFGTQPVVLCAVNGNGFAGASTFNISTTGFTGVTASVNGTIQNIAFSFIAIG